MKDLSEMNFPADFRYSDDHEWAQKKDDIVRVGICDFAQSQLGDIVFVELPQIGKKVERNGQFGVVESVKSVSDLLSPVSGEVVSVNDDLQDNPNLINESPYDKGWIVEVKVSDSADWDMLMNSADYITMLKGN